MHSSVALSCLQAPQQLGLSRVSQRPSGPQPAPSASSPRADYQEGEKLLGTPYVCAAVACL